MSDSLFYFLMGLLLGLSLLYPTLAYQHNVYACEYVAVPKKEGK